MARVPVNYVKLKGIDWDGELFACFNLPLCLQGISIQPPSFGVWSLLDIIDSKFVSDLENCSIFDIWRFVYIAVNRKKALEEIQEWIRAGGRDNLVTIETTDNWLKWDYTVANFGMKNCDKLNIDDIVKIRQYFDLSFVGYGMIPDQGGESYKYLFGADSVGRLLCYASKLQIPYNQVIWDTPIIIIGFIASAEARANGVKGVSRPKDPEDIIRQTRAADKREKQGKLHPWQIENPSHYRLMKLQIDNNPAIKDEWEMLYNKQNELKEDYEQFAKEYLEKCQTSQ